MKISTLAIGATIVAAAMFAACGGGGDAANDNDGDSTSKITTQHGLAVAALYADSNRASNLSADDGAAPAAENAGGDAAASDAITSDVDKSGVAGAPQQLADGTLGITVSGFGLASADPDSAVIELYFSRYGYCCNDVVPQPAPDLPADGSSSSGSGSAPDIKPTTGAGGEVEPITQADVQSVIDALTNAGVAADDIEFIEQTYFDAYNASATVRATVNNIDIVDAAVEGATNAGSNLGDISFSSNVMYTLQDCDALESAALDAAVTDAGERGALLADALNVTLGSVVGASDYSYSPSGVPCSGGYHGPMYYDAISARGTAGGSGQVQVVAQISVTYAMS